MNYYKQGDAANADKIKAALKAKGISDSGNSFIYDNYLYFTKDGETDFCAANGRFASIIKTHPDYQELELPVEPKFKVGDWLYHNILGVLPILVKDFSETLGYKVECIGLTYYVKQSTIENEYRPWTISDAKDGDVLYSLDNKQPFIYKERPQFSQARGYCCINKFGEFAVWNTNKCVICTDKYIPATKEQRDLLFKKMKEAGYEWNEKKKELKKIKVHYDIANFKAGMPVLVRDEDDGCWTYVLFSHSYVCRDGKTRFNAGLVGFTQCIPFEGNEHLLGTTEPCGEEYINW